MTAAWSLAEDDRRGFLRNTALGLFSFQIAGCDRLLTPREAREQGADLAIFSAEEGALLESFGESLVPGAREAGLLHFVDANLQRAPGDSLLTARYLDILPPHADFYTAGLKALQAYATAKLGKGFGQASEAERAALIRPMLGGTLEGWDGPPPPLFYLAVRSDAIDLVYGTSKALERMSVPPMAHIQPKSDW